MSKNETVKAILQGREAQRIDTQHGAKCLLLPCGYEDLSVDGFSPEYWTLQSRIRAAIGEN